MQDSIYHMTLKYYFISDFFPKRQDFALRKCDIFMDVNYEVICIFNPLVDYRY